MQREPLVFEKSKKGKKAFDITVDEKYCKNRIDEKFLRKDKPDLMELSEVDIVRHFTFLSKQNYGVDDGFYPLGSCTMKYNPKINEKLASLDGFLNLHPLTPTSHTQGILKVLFELENMLCEICGMDAFTLQPAAGAHGESTGLLLIKAYHQNKGNIHKDTIIIPDSAHGTNPASAAVTGFKVVTVRSNDKGLVDLDHLKTLIDENTAGLMLTNPNTLGLFETEIKAITDIIHSVDGLVYYDGANANAILGITRPGDMGFDIVHLNLHKTFSTPHGGGGPGSGPVGIKSHLKPFLPVPVVSCSNDMYNLDYNLPKSIGKVRSFYGNIGVLIRAYAYILTMGPKGLKNVSYNAIINANYLKAKLSKSFDIPYKDSFAMHEFVISFENNKKDTGLSSLDAAKALIEYGYHPPTIYFPLIVHESMMIEPTETEDIDTLQEFVDIMKKILLQSKEDIETLKNYPISTYVGRLDETTAARNPILKYSKDSKI